MDTPTMTSPADAAPPLVLEALVLAGGQSRRMGGHDKALLDFNGKPLFETAVDRLLAQTLCPVRIHISANRNAARYDERGFQTLPDLRFDSVGPLGGVEAALREVETDYLLVVPCDMPDLPADLAERLAGALLAGQALAAYATTADGPQPVCCLLHRALAPRLSEWLDAGRRHTEGWLKQVDAVAVPFANASAFINLNTPEALDAHRSGALLAANPTEAGLTHFDAAGQAQMVDVGAKPETTRLAVAEGRILMQAATLERIRQGDHRKGDVLGVARIAAIMAAKRCGELIPLCHPIPLTSVQVDFRLDAQQHAVVCTVRSETVGRTGVEMEAMTAVSVALLTIYDMCKAVDRGMTLEAVRLLEKRGGSSGHWQREV